MSFEDDLKAAEDAPIEYTDVDVLINGNLHTLRFLQLNGGEWAAEADKHPARPGVLLDAQYIADVRRFPAEVGAWRC